MAGFLPPRTPRGPNAFESLLGGLAESVPQAFQQFQNQNRQREAAEKLGLDPAVFALPQEGQAAYFKSKFAPEKQMSPLQETQQRLAEEKLKALQGQQDIFDRLKGKQPTIGKEPRLEAQETGIGSFSDMDLRELAAFKGQPGQAGILGNIADAELQERKESLKTRSKKETEYFKFNEPKLAELSQNERKTDLENARFSRMEQLFSDPSKFPSPLLASIFSKDGQINDVIYSQMTPEAQEAVKLIVDSTSNIKDTYGSRVTNFDLQTYLKKLPSLLMSPEGRQRVIRDLMTINDINQLHNRGIQEIFEDVGGSDKIPFSKAESIFKKKYGSQIERMMKDFITPERKVFTDRPDPKQYLGKKIKDKDTDEIFISDGENWIPFEG